MLKVTKEVAAASMNVAGVQLQWRSNFIVCLIAQKMYLVMSSRQRVNKSLPILINHTQNCQDFSPLSHT